MWHRQAFRDLVKKTIDIDKIDEYLDEDEEEDAYERVYGGWKGSDSMYVKLISSDGHEFIIKREHAMISATVTAMLAAPRQFSEHEPNEIKLREIPSHLLEKLCAYFAYKLYYTECPTEIPEETPKFFMALNIAPGLLMAAHVLQC